MCRTAGKVTIPLPLAKEYTTKPKRSRQYTRVLLLKQYTIY